MPCRTGKHKASHESRSALVDCSREVKVAARGGSVSTSREALFLITEVRAFIPQQSGPGLACSADGHAVRAGEAGADGLLMLAAIGAGGPKIACLKMRKVVRVLAL